MQSRFLELLDRLGSESRIHYSLDHITQALHAVGDPHLSVKTIVIAGTNGKGSVSLFVSSALKEAGMEVGTFLSPHLQHPRERFLFQGKPLPDATLDALAEAAWAPTQEFQLSYFEFLTLMVFLWAREAKLDALILEVGLGGRLDSTNVTAPVATAITTIAFDHQAYLGNDLVSILKEKMGVLRPGVPVFTQIDSPPLMAALEARAAELGSEIHYTWRTPPSRESLEWSGQSVRLQGHEFELQNPGVGMADNAALAFDLVRETFPSIPIPTLQRAFANVRNPGRLEVVQENPRVVLSGDHNPAGIEYLIETLRELKTRPRIVCAFSPDKPQAEMVARLKEVTDDLVLTQVPRFADKMPADYQSLAPFDPDPKHAVHAALARCKPEDTLLVTGSLYLVGEVREIWFPQ